MGRPALRDSTCPKCGATNTPDETRVRSKRTRHKTGSGNPLKIRQRQLECLVCGHTWKEAAEPIHARQ